MTFTLTVTACDSDTLWEQVGNLPGGSRIVRYAGIPYQEDGEVFFEIILEFEAD